MEGLIHIYCGDGKGKTTAAVGLAVRAAGAGKKVIFTQFFKDGSSSEIKMLETLPGVELVLCRVQHGFYKFMDEAGRAAARRDFSSLLDTALTRAAEGADLLVLDEAISACNCGVIDEEKLAAFLTEKPAGLEVVLTGRNPSERLLARADYITEMKKIRHPYDQGITARLGVEY